MEIVGKILYRFLDLYNVREVPELSEMFEFFIKTKLLFQLLSHTLHHCTALSQASIVSVNSS